MIDTFQIFNKLKDTMQPDAARMLTEVIGMVYEDLKKTVTKTEFNELREIVRDLGEAQKRTEKRVEELAEAQKRTEKRVEELAEAQKRTEKRVEELAEAQKRTEKRVEELAEAQKKTEIELRKLVIDHRETRKQLGGLTATVGYTLENEAYKALPRLLKRDYNIVVKDRLKRRYLRDNRGEELEINIVGDATRNNTEIVIIGESKSQLSRQEVDRFIRRKLKRFEGVFQETFGVIITHMISSADLEEYAKSKGIALYYSYDF